MPAEDEFDFAKWARTKPGKRLRVRESLMAAVDHLATAAGNISSRLSGAYFIMGLERQDELPENLRDEYGWIVARITERKAYQNGASVFTVARSIRGKQAVRVATAILRLHRRMEAQSKHPFISSLL